MIFQVRCEVFAELKACVTEVCFDGAFALTGMYSDRFDGQFLKVVQEKHTFAGWNQCCDSIVKVLSEF